MPNIPFTKKKVQSLPKGMNLTREILEFNKKTGEFTTYPNRRQRRDRMFRPLKVLNISFIQQVPIYKYYILSLKKGKFSKEVSKKEYDKSNADKRMDLIGYKSIIHYKN